MSYHGRRELTAENAVQDGKVAQCALAASAPQLEECWRGI